MPRFADSSDLSDLEWNLMAALLPPKLGGRGCEVDIREVVNAIFYGPEKRLCLEISAARFSAGENGWRLFPSVAPRGRLGARA